MRSILRVINDSDSQVFGSKVVKGKSWVEIRFIFRFFWVCFYMGTEDKF